MATVLKYKHGNCAFCKEKIRLIQPINQMEPYYDCKCEEWQKKNYLHGLAGELDKDNPFVVYCNEKEYKGGFLLKCCEGCRHNPLPPQ